MKREQEKVLLANAKSNLQDLKELLALVNEEHTGEDGVYRYYHGSFKVFRVQDLTVQIVAALKALQPESTLNPRFLNIINAGTGKLFTLAANKKWDEETLPMLTAFFHARFILETVIKYAQELNVPPDILPTGWGAVLYTYQLR